MAKYNTKSNQNIILFVVISIILIYFIFYSLELEENADVSIQTRTLDKDGFCVLYNPAYVQDPDELDDKKALEIDVLAKLPPGYVFIDYVYKIHDVALSTFHRDVTSSKHIYKTRHPVYTLILYKYDGELLSVCPGSNQTYPFVWSRIVNVQGKSGTVFLFDSDLLHAGQTNNCQDRNVVQYKICHRSDLDKLSSLRGINVEKNDKCEINYYNYFMRKLSYYFEMPVNYILYPLMVKREDENSLIGKIQSYIPMTFYNN